MSAQSQFLSTIDALQRAREGRQVGTYYSRPNIAYGDVWCRTCQKPCDFEITCGHASNPANSEVYIQASCHGEKCDVFMTFSQWHDAKKKLIEVFDDFSLPEPARPAVSLMPLAEMPLLLMDRQPE